VRCGLQQPWAELARDVPAPRAPPAQGGALRASALHDLAVHDVASCDAAWPRDRALELGLVSPGPFAEPAAAAAAATALTSRARSRMVLTNGAA